MNGQSAMPAQRPFLGKSHVGLFEALAVDVSPQKRATPIVGAYAVGYRVRMKIEAALPPVEGTGEVTITGQRGEGAGAGALGLEDWLPQSPGGRVVLAFDADHMAKAKDYEFLGAGSAALAAWTDCERFYDAIRRGGTLDPQSMAAAMSRRPPPNATFFRLVFGFSRGVFDDPGVVAALGAYYGDQSVSPLERRTQIAYYSSNPKTGDAAALGALASGMFQVVFDLAGAGKASSAGVVFQRMYGYLRGPGGAYRVAPPPNGRQFASQVRELMAWRPAGVPAEVQKSISGWLAGAP